MAYTRPSYDSPVSLRKAHGDETTAGPSDATARPAGGADAPARRYLVVAGRRRLGPKPTSDLPCMLSWGRSAPKRLRSTRVAADAGLGIRSGASRAGRPNDVYANTCEHVVTQHRAHARTLLGVRVRACASTTIIGAPAPERGRNCRHVNGTAVARTYFRPRLAAAPRRGGATHRRGRFPSVCLYMSLIFRGHGCENTARIERRYGRASSVPGRAHAAGAPARRSVSSAGRSRRAHRSSPPPPGPRAGVDEFFVFSSRRRRDEKSLHYRTTEANAAGTWPVPMVAGRRRRAQFNTCAVVRFVYVRACFVLTERSPGTRRNADGRREHHTRLLNSSRS